jgi:hypothetical protein
MMYPGIIQFPIYFVDSTWYNRRSSSKKPDIENLLEGNGLKVFDFHPPHITYNTPSKQYYKNQSDEYYNEELSIEKIRFDGYGVRDLFIDLLEYMEKRGMQSETLGEISISDHM